MDQIIPDKIVIQKEDSIQELRNLGSNKIETTKIEIQHPLHKKWSFRLRISSVNVTKSADSCGFGHIHRGNP